MTFGFMWQLFKSLFKNIFRDANKREKGENIARIGGMLHTQFLLKIFPLHAHL